jgi:hypothetical protein
MSMGYNTGLKFVGLTFDDGHPDDEVLFPARVCPSVDTLAGWRTGAKFKLPV